MDCPHVLLPDSTFCFVDDTEAAMDTGGDWFRLTDQVQKWCEQTYKPDAWRFVDDDHFCYLVFRTEGDAQRFRDQWGDAR